MGFPLFTVLAVILIASALLVVLQENPLYSALSLIVTLFVLALFFLFLKAELIAVLQILVYAGAIMVLFLFVIMLLNLGQRTQDGWKGLWITAVVAGSGFLAFQLLVPFGQSETGQDTQVLTSPYFGSVRDVARLLFTDYLLAFEVTSLLLLAALIGAVVLARQEKRP